MHISARWKPRPAVAYKRRRTVPTAIPTRLLNSTSTQGQVPQQRGSWPYGSWQPQDADAAQQTDDDYAMNDQQQALPWSASTGDQPNGQVYNNGYTNGFSNAPQHTNGFNGQHSQYPASGPYATDYAQGALSFPPMYEAYPPPTVSPELSSNGQRNYPPYYGRAPEPQPKASAQYNGLSAPYGSPGPYAAEASGTAEYSGFGTQSYPAQQSYRPQQSQAAHPTYAPVEPVYGAPDIVEDNVLLVRGMEGTCLVEHPGSVVVVGDVGPGSKVVAGGNVFVWGRLQGTAHAGAYGQEPDPMVVAAHMQPRELQINQLAAYPPEQPAGLPVVALLDEYGSSIELERTKKIYAPQAEEAAPPVQVPSTLSGPGRIALVTGVYITLVGVLLLLWPQLLYRFVDPGGVTTGWIRVGGCVCALFGFYYGGAAYGETQRLGLGGFYLSTVAGRVFVSVVLSLLVLVRQLDLAMLAVAAVNLFGAYRMARSISTAVSAC